MRFRGGTLVAAIAVLAGSSAAFGQVQLPGPAPGNFGATPPATTAAGVGVLERPHPDYDPLGVRAGSFIIFPRVDVGANYDSNVFSTDTGVKSDFYTDVAPDVLVDSDWENHALDLDLGGDMKRYATQVSENYTNAHAIANGRLDVLNEVYILSGAQYQLAHEDRTSPNSIVGQKNPTEYQVGGLGLGYVHEPGRLGFRIDAIGNYFTYDNAQTATGATVVETDRNRWEYAVKPRLEYEIIPNYRAFVQASGNWRTYQSKFDQFGIKRDSAGWEADVGTAIDLTNLISGEIFAGYLDQYYADPRLKTAGGVGFGSNLLWTVTELTSLRLGVTRTVQETIVNNGGVGAAFSEASSDLATGATLSVEHELLRNVLLQAGLIYGQDDFQGLQRTDNTYGANAEARYLINRVWTASLDFTYQDRVSNQSINNYQREVISARVGVHF